MNKLFIIGLPRTGTTSISVSLLHHNYKVAHTAYTKRAFELANVISDAPCFCDYPQLDKLFPGSKFVYLDRALDKWIPSIQMLLAKMHQQLDLKTGYLNPVLKRCMHKTFQLAVVEDPLQSRHLEHCYQNHQQEVFQYFSERNDLLKIDISTPGSLRKLLTFLDSHHEEEGEFPLLNTGLLVDSWKNYKHPNKVNSNSAGVEHRKYFDF